jgi:hypothetical protein
MLLYGLDVDCLPVYLLGNATTGGMLRPIGLPNVGLNVSFGPGCILPIILRYMHCYTISYLWHCHWLLL